MSTVSSHNRLRPPTVPCILIKQNWKPLNYIERAGCLLAFIFCQLLSTVNNQHPLPVSHFGISVQWVENVQLWFKPGRGFPFWPHSEAHTDFWPHSAPLPISCISLQLQNIARLKNNNFLANPSRAHIGAEENEKWVFLPFKAIIQPWRYDF